MRKTQVSHKKVHSQDSVVHDVRENEGNYYDGYGD